MPWTPDSPTDSSVAPVKAKGKWVPDAERPSALKQIGQGIVEQASSLGPIMGGAAMGAELGTLGGPLAPVTVPVGGLIGATAGGFATPAIESLARRVMGQPTEAPTYGQAAKGALTGVESELGGQIAGQAVPAIRGIKRALTGETEIGEAATQAVAGAEAATVAQREKLTDAATKEALAQKQAAAKAAEKAGQAGLAERAGMYQQATAAQQSIADTHTAAQAKLDQTMAHTREQLGKEIEPEARAETVSGTLPQPGEGPMEASPERISRGEQFRNTVLGPLRRWRADWATRRDAFLEPYATTRVDDAKLREAVGQEMQKWPPGHAPYSPRVVKLLQKAGAAAGEGAPDDFALLKAHGYDDDAIQTMKPQMRDQIAGTFRNEWMEQHPVGGEQPSVSMLVGLQSEANALARASKGADRTAALRVVHGVDDTLADLEVPSLKGVNAEYRDHRAHFPYAFENAIEGAPQPLAASKEIFSDPERVLDLAKLSTPEERGQLGQLYSDHIREAGDKAVDPTVVKALGFNGPLAKPESWVYAKNAVDRLGEMFDTAPRAKAKFEAAMAEAEGQAKDQYATTILKDARTELMKLGPTGKRIQAQIDAAPTLYEKATVAVKAMGGMDPGRAVKDLAATQAGAPGRAAYGAFLGAPQGARQAMRGFQPQDPEQAAVESITGSERGKGFVDRWRRRAEFWIPLAGAGAVIGRPSTYAMAGLAMGAPIAAREGLAAAYRASLRDPQAALEFYRALQNPGSQQGLKTLAKYVVQATTLSAMPKDEPPAQPGRPTPMVKAAETKRAEAIAGPKAPPAKVKTVKDTARKVTAGKTPNVHHDLETGKLSLGHVRKMIDAGGSPDLASLFQGLSPSDAIQVLAKANAQEKDLFLPAVAQKLNDSRGKVPPQEQQSLMAQLQRAVQSA